MSRPLGRHLLLCIALGACAGTDVGNPPAQPPPTFATVSLGLRGVDEGTGSGLTLRSGDRVDEAWIVLDGLRLRGAESCEGAPAGPDDVAGPIAAELVSGRVLPEAPRFDAAAGSYCRLELALDALTTGTVPGAPAELTGASVLVKGARADGVPFTVVGALGPAVELDAREAPLELAAGAVSLELRFALDRWLAAVKLAELSPEDGAAGPAIVVDAETNESRLDELASVLADSASLHGDLDGDGTEDELARGRTPEDDDGGGGSGGDGGEGGDGGTGGEGGTGGAGG